ncbi:MAG: MATE family efflux transporter [Ruminococcaceae bacterium]|nr:MATE family efflux transporter [Oscillospiraceae bacterium]
MPNKHHLHDHSRPLTLKRKKDVDMTQGNITRHIISFALPLLIGNIFQQLYNTVDTWVVGNYVSNAAFSAVGTVGPVINMLIGFFMGLSSGAGVVISQYYGAKRHEDVSRTVHTALVMTAILGVLFTVVGISMIPTMLRFMKTPADVLPESTAYLTIYFSGIAGLMFYNIGAGILRAVGDSQRPFYFLVVCAVINTVLDLVFVLVFHMGVEGVALATIIAQGVSAILVIITLMRADSSIKVRFRCLRIHWPMLKKIFIVGIPAALQMAITSFSNVFVQSYINFFGSDCMSGWTAYAKVDQLLFLPMQSISLAATTFVGQNLGCNQVDRAKAGVRKSLILAMISTAILMVPVIAFSSPVVAFFNDKAEVVEFGSLFLRWLSPFYLVCCFNQIYSGALRGAGNSKATMVIMVSSFVVFRQIYLYAMSHICNEVLPIAMSYPAGWILCSVITMIYYSKVNLGKSRLVDDNDCAPQSVKS